MGELSHRQSLAATQSQPTAAIDIFRLEKTIAPELTFDPGAIASMLFIATNHRRPFR